MDDETIGEEVVVGLDVEIVRLTDTGRLDLDDPIPGDQLVRRPVPSPRDRKRLRGGDVIADSERCERVPSARSEHGVLRRRRDRPAERGADAVDHPEPARRGVEHAAAAELHVRVAGERVPDARASAHDVFDRDPAPRVGVDHARLAHDALREAVERERGDRVHDLLRRAPPDPLPRHARAELRLHLAHAPRAALEAERAPQLLGLDGAEAGRRHRHPEELLLEERHAERALQDRLEARVQVGHGLAPAPAPDVGMHHVAHDRPGADDRDLHDEVVEALGADARERRHLGAALDLEDAERVRLLEAPVHGGVVGRQPSQVHLPARLADEADRVLEHRHHAEPEQVHLDDAERRAVVLVPLDHGAARHRRGLERHHVVEAARGDHHAARVLAEVARQVLDARPERGERADAGLARIHARLREVTRQQLVRVLVAPGRDEAGEAIL